LNTIATDRLYSDPRLKRLGREVGCPAKALGLLMWMWHGTQNLGLVVASECDILDALPQGLRNPRKTIEALVRTGWLEDLGDSYRVVGNEIHVQNREVITENARNAARVRWEKENARRMQGALPGASSDDAGRMPPPAPAPPPTSPAEDPNKRAPPVEAPRKQPIGTHHPEVAFFAAKYAEHFPDALPLDDDGRENAGIVIRLCADAKRDWRVVLEAFADKRWEFANGRLGWLADAEHLSEVLVWLGKGKPAKKPAASPAPFGPIPGSLTSEQTKARQRESEEQTRKHEAERRKATDPEQAKHLLASIIGKL
jgi:hypothetical protein